ncbi:MAG TPA: excinuclease ABC subunit UvrA [Chthoniobacterales bacterium]|jgi:excinuclease ABC subunit A
MPAVRKTPPAPASQTPPLADSIRIRNVRQNNLKGIDLDLPLNQLIVVTGPSGSGKSSLAFDTIYAEGQRRYVETFSPYTRQFLDRMDKPRVDEIVGIPPAIAIEQKNGVRTTRSTVGTMTEINDYLKLLVPRLARAFCPVCDREIRPETAQSIVTQLQTEHAGETILITFGIPVPPKTQPADFFKFLNAQGYLRVWRDGKIHRTDEAPTLTSLHGIVEVVQDRITVQSDSLSRLTEAIETALNFGKGKLLVTEIKSGRSQPFSKGWHCAHCDETIRPPTPGLFSFNNPLGACPTCRGFGRTIGLDLDRALPDKSLSIAEGVVKPFQSGQSKECQSDLMRHAQRQLVDVYCPFADLTAADQKWVLQGEGGLDVTNEELWQNDQWYGVKGFFDWMEARTYKMHVRVFLSRYRAYTECPDCRGGRFQPATLNYQLVDQAGKRYTLPQLSRTPVRQLAALLDTFDIPPTDKTGTMVRGEVVTRLRYLDQVGLGYLDLDRSTRTLSGGEVERVNLTTCLGASLVNTLFVMDEPTVGLHPRDVSKLIGVMQQLRNKGNTLLVVEHEEAVIRAADYLIDIGPGRGNSGGELVFAGNAADLTTNKRSLTGAYLYGRKSIPVPAKRRKAKSWLTVKGATENNLRDLDVKFPLGLFTCVTGVSGSGKSSLVHTVLHENLLRIKGLPTGEIIGQCKTILGGHAVDQVVMVDQSPLARSPRSTPAVYLGVFDELRKLFADSSDAQTAGFTASTFSFNSGTGRCQRCNGLGFEKVEMQFLSDLFIRCSECEGKRYQPHVLAIQFHGKSIHDVLELTVSEAIEFFHAHGGNKKILEPFRTLESVGLGYLKLGQPVNVLSGGESQRLKLVGHLVEKANLTQKSLLIFDEPTTGLHFDDVALLLTVFQKLVDAGNTLIVIEHNLEVIKSADHVIDLGPEAGAEGGLVIAEGTPEHVAENEESHTGRYLHALLEGTRVKEVPIPRLLRNRHSEGITIHGAREHNLKNFTLTLPREKMITITGLSGSGKSTLAFDLLFAEGQRRFLDSMSPYARQFVEQLEKPDVDHIEGLPPSVAIEQRITRGGGKSTVATVTEVYHFLRLMFAKLGTQYCPKCQIPVEGQTVQRIVEQVEKVAGKKTSFLLATVIKARKGFHTDVAAAAAKDGFETLLVDGKFVSSANFEKLERFKEHTIDVVVADLSKVSKTEVRPLVERALKIGKRTAKIYVSGVETILSTEMTCPKCARAFEELDPRLFSFNSPHGWCTTCNGFGEIFEVSVNLDENASVLERELAEERAHETMEEGEAKPCHVCKGARLNEVARNVRLNDLTIDRLAHGSVRNSLETVAGLTFEKQQLVISEDIIPEITQRLKFMENVGLSYLALDRSAKTLSGGESQRIRLAAQLGSNLRGVLYVLDEPTIGLHPRDNDALLDTLQALKDKGNTLVIVEHDEETMRRSDIIVDLGPGAGMNGGEVVAQGTLAEIKANKNSQTGRYLKSPMKHPLNGSRRSLSKVNWLQILKADVNNLKKVTAKFPIGRLTAITGISGSGKSTLMRAALRPAVEEALNKKGKISGKYPVVKGVEHLEAIYEVDQSPIGKSSRSIPATYIKVFDEIRLHFAALPMSRMRGYTNSRFSFNTEGGRCETCAGQGVIKMEMNFLPASYVPCEDCGGTRYNAQTREVEYNGKNIGDVMNMTIAQAAEFFSASQKIHRTLQLLVDTGLGYLKLGQPSPTLSGGEAQRLKLVSELRLGAARDYTNKVRKMKVAKSTLYLLEEPTIGLHMADVEMLLGVIQRLVDVGHTVIVIEHNLNVIAEADYIIDIGPEAGASGGEVVATGTPEEIAAHAHSRIAPYLKQTLAGK